MRVAVCASVVIVVLLALSGAVGQELKTPRQAARDAEARTSPEVIIKPNSRIKNASDVYLRGKRAKFGTITDVRHSYHPAEHYSNHLYILRREGGDEAYRTNPDWTDELWRYASDMKGTKLFAAQGLDFRVRPDEKMIAVTVPSKQDNYKRDLLLLDGGGKLIKEFPRKQLAAFDVDFRGWNGARLWLTDVDESQIRAFVSIDTPSMKITKYALPGEGVEESDADFDPARMRLVYSDYPLFLETEGERDFARSRKPVHLYVYDLKTKQRRLIAQSIAKPFLPKWVNSTTVQYDDPHGKGRVSKRL